MPSRRALLAVAVVVVAVLATGVWLWRDRGAPPSPGPIPGRAPEKGIRADDATLVSPDLAVKLVEIRGTPRQGYTDWSCILECRETEGCRALVRVHIEYRSEGVTKTLVVDGRVDADTGEVIRIGRVERSTFAVDSIERATLSVIEEYRSDQPRPEILG